MNESNHEQMVPDRNREEACSRLNQADCSQSKASASWMELPADVKSYSPEESSRPFSSLPKLKLEDNDSSSVLDDLLDIITEDEFNTLLWS